MPGEVVAVKQFQSILASDLRTAGLNAHQGVLLLKQDKILRSQIVKKLMDALQGESIPPARISAALGFDITDIDSDLQAEVVDTPEFFEIQQNSQTRDGIIDSLITENAKLKSARDDIVFELIQIKIKHGMLKYEELNNE